MFLQHHKHKNIFNILYTNLHPISFQLILNPIEFESTLRICIQSTSIQFEFNAIQIAFNVIHSIFSFE